MIPPAIYALFARGCIEVSKWVEKKINESKSKK